MCAIHLKAPKIHALEQGLGIFCGVCGEMSPLGGGKPAAEGGIPPVRPVRPGRRGDGQQVSALAESGTRDKTETEMAC
jgi:hypothetical protein